MNAESDAPKTSSRLCVRTASLQTHAKSKITNSNEPAAVLLFVFARHILSFVLAAAAADERRDSEEDAQ